MTIWQPSSETFFLQKGEIQIFNIFFVKDASNSHVGFARTKGWEVGKLQVNEHGPTVKWERQGEQWEKERGDTATQNCKFWEISMYWVFSSKVSKGIPSPGQ